MIDTYRFHVRKLFRAGFHFLHNNVTGIHALIDHKMLDRCQRYFLHFSKQGIVAPHYRHVSGHLILHIMQRVHNAKGDHVVEPRDGRQIRMLLKKIFRQVIADPIL